MKDTIKHNGITYKFDSSGGYEVVIGLNGIIIRWLDGYWRAYCKDYEIEIEDKFIRKECGRHLKFLQRLEAGR